MAKLIADYAIDQMQQCRQALAVLRHRGDPPPDRLVKEASLTRDAIEDLLARGRGG